jgi:elongator complex protein 2
MIMNITINVIIINIDYGDADGSKQALGLMTKQVKIEVVEEDETFDYSNFNPDVLTNKTDVFNSKYNYSVPPDEDFLTNNTLWPETNKLYGHGYEVFCTAASHDGSIIASGGKALSEKHAKLFIWDAKKNILLSKLDGHTLTIVQIEFSHDDKYLLTVSRDRSWCLYEKTNEPILYKLIHIEKEAHGRIIWGCSWTPDSSLFITGSRDKFLKVWEKEGDTFVNKHSFEFEDSVTSVNIIPRKINNQFISILGFESGNIELYSITTGIKFITKINEYLSHGSSVKRIKSFITDNTIRFATCSEDNSTRIFDISLNYLESLIK